MWRVSSQRGMAFTLSCSICVLNYGDFFSPVRRPNVRMIEDMWLQIC